MRHVDVNTGMTDNAGMAKRRTFGDWLKTTREEQGYSQSELGEMIDMHRTYVNNLERADKWPRPETRERFHRVFGTTDDDLVCAGIAERKVFPRPGRPDVVRYEQIKVRTVSMDDVPDEVKEMLVEIDWSSRNTEMVTRMLMTFIDDDDTTPSSHPDTHDEPRPAVAPSPRTSRQR